MIHLARGMKFDREVKQQSANNQRKAHDYV